jgi:hypothetical protein
VDGILSEESDTVVMSPSHIMNSSQQHAASIAPDINNTTASHKRQQKQ